MRGVFLLVACLSCAPVKAGDPSIPARPSTGDELPQACLEVAQRILTGDAAKFQVEFWPVKAGGSRGTALTKDVEAASLDEVRAFTAAVARCYYPPEEGWQEYRMAVTVLSVSEPEAGGSMPANDP